MLEDELEPNGITLELEMQWDGNPNIVLDIKTKLGVSLPVQVIRSFLFLMVKISLIHIGRRRTKHSL